MSAARAVARLATLAVLAASAFAAPALAASPVGEQVQISQAGADGDASRNADNPSAAFNPVTGLALVVWTADDQQDDRYEVYGRFVNADAAPQGGEFLIASGGSDAALDATRPRVAYNTMRNEFLVVWPNPQSAGPEDWEIAGQRVGPTGALLGSAKRISDMGPGDNSFRATEPQVVYNPARDEYVAIWHGTNDSLPGRVEVWAHRVNGATAEPQGEDVRISSLRNEGAWPTIAYNSVDNEYLVAFIGKDSATELQSQRIYVQRLTADVALVGGNRQIFQAGETHKPAVTHNPASNEYLVAMPGIVGGDSEAYVQRLNALGAEIGIDDQRVSHMGPDLALDYGTMVDVAVGFSPSGKYLVTWSGDTTSFGLVKDETEIFGQELDGAGAEIGDDFPISSMGPDGTPQYGVTNFQFTGPLAHAPGPDRFFVVWDGDNGPPLADNEFETFARMVAATPAPAPAAPPSAPKPGLKLMPDFVPLFTTKRRGRKGVKGYLYAVSGLRSLPYGTIVSLRCESGCKLKQVSFTVRTRGKKRKTSYTLRKRVAITKRSRLRITARHAGYVSRYIRYAFVRTKPGITARRVGSGCQTPSKPARKTRCVAG